MPSKHSMVSTCSCRLAISLFAAVCGCVCVTGCFTGCSDNSSTNSIAAPPNGKRSTDSPSTVDPNGTHSKTVHGQNGSTGPTAPKAAIPIPEAPAEPLHEPIVLMTDLHAQSCKVKVGDVMPEITLPDLAGNQKSLAQLYGDKLTVVVFWNSRYIFALEQYLRLGDETADLFSVYGVSVVAINVGDEQAVAQAAAERAESSLPCLLDQRGEALQKVATGKLPRTYLLDAEGRILWLDIEYSRSTERELRNAVYYFLRQTDPATGEFSLDDDATAPTANKAASYHRIAAEGTSA